MATPAAAARAAAVPLSPRTPAAQQSAAPMVAQSQETQAVFQALEAAVSVVATARKGAALFAVCAASWAAHAEWPHSLGVNEYTLKSVESTSSLAKRLRLSKFTLDGLPLASAVCAHPKTINLKISCGYAVSQWQLLSCTLC